MGERSALIVATSIYIDPTFSELRSPSGDAEALNDVLADAAIGQFDVTTVLNVGKMQAEREIERLLDEAQPDDLVMLYITGHGVRHHSGKLYFIANDTEFSLLRSTAISASFVNETMSASSCDRIIVMLDCCFSGAFAQGFATKGVQTQLDLTAEDEAAGLGGRGRVVISASNAMEYAYEGPDLLSENVHRSVFTSAVVDGLRSGDADVDRDGRVSVDDLYSYTYQQVRSRQSGQTLVKSTSGLEGTLFIARSPRWIAHDRPRWDPVSGRCENVGGAPVVDRQWQVSAPRDLDVGRSVPPGQVIELGLRNKFGAPTEVYHVSATVFSPATLARLVPPAR